MEFVPGDPDWVIALKVNGREVYSGERVPCDAPVVLVVGNSSLGSSEEEDDWMMDGGTMDDATEVEDGYEEEL